MAHSRAIAPCLICSVGTGPIVTSGRSQQGNFTVSLPFCHRKLSASKLKPSGYPTQLENIGHHIRKRRMDLNLLQREVAVILGVDKATIENWEYGRTSPNLRARPAVLRFLGYDPRPPCKTVGERLHHHREGLGLSLDEAAKVICVGPSTVARWEHRADQRQNHISIPRIAAFLGRNLFSPPESTAELVRQARLLLGLTQRDLGLRLGVCQDTVCRCEPGK